jgi:hypothetical protein
MKVFETNSQLLRLLKIVSELKRTLDISKELVDTVQERKANGYFDRH